jgi:hypothetical protein
MCRDAGGAGPGSGKVVQTRGGAPVQKGRGRVEREKRARLELRRQKERESAQVQRRVLGGESMSTLGTQVCDKRSDLETPTQRTSIY